MDIVGSQFEDDLFDQPKVKEEKQSSKYEAKILSPLWFMTADMKGKEDSDILIILKHQADYFYSLKDFVKAAEMYQRCLELLPSSNTTWQREFMENVARSLLHIGNAEKALEWSLRLDECSISPDQKVVSMNLLAIVCHKLGKYKEELEALHSCMEIHKSNPDFWYRLGLCYAGLFKINLPECSLLQSTEELEAESCCPFRSRINTLVKKSSSSETSNKSAASSGSAENASASASSKCDTCIITTQMVSSCLIHTKLLIDSGGKNLFSPERDENIKIQINKSLELMEIDPLFVEVASQMLGSNFLNPFDACVKLKQEHNSSEDPTVSDQDHP